MNPVIRISDENWDRLKSYAQPFEDSPNDALAKVFSQVDDLLIQGQKPNGQGNPLSVEIEPDVQAVGQTSISPRVVENPAKHKRLARGLKTPRSEYRIPVLVAYKRLGGTATRPEIVAQVRHAMNDRLSEYDLAELKSGGTRWVKDVQFTIYDLAEEGLLEPGARRSQWSLTARGRNAI